MVEQAKTQQSTPALADKTVLGHPNTIGILGVVFGVLIPPLGLLLAGWTLYKAGQLAKRSLLILGILGLVATVAGAGLYKWVYNERHKSSFNSTYTYSAFQTYKLDGTGKGTGLSFTRPTAFEPQQTAVFNNFQASFVQFAPISGYPNKQGISSIDANIAFPSVTFSKAYLQGLDQAFSSSGFSTSRYKSFKANSVNWLLSHAVPRTSVTLSDAQKFTNNNIKQHAWTFDYSASSTYTNGTPRNLKGRLFFAAGKSYYYYLSVVSNASNWDANSNTWKTVFDSLKIDQ